MINMDANRRGNVGQAEASETIKKIHSLLRKEVKNDGDFGQVWKEHKCNSSKLEEYSKAMVTLADIWKSSHPPEENRVDWCISICREYFWKGGLQKLLEKEMKKTYYDALRNGDSSLGSIEEYVDSRSFMWDLSRGFQDRRLALLDVGSCYNPFEEFSQEVNALAIDLCPANKNVYQADFLELQVDSHLRREQLIQTDQQPEGVDPIIPHNNETELLATDTDEKTASGSSRNTNGQRNNTSFAQQQSKKEYFAHDSGKNRPNIDPCGRPRGDNVLSTNIEVTGDKDGTVVIDDANIEKTSTSHLTDPINTLPGNYFDTIVFSLLLSYLPMPKQRWDCCVKANELLRQNGLLMLIESDSAHQNRNAHQIRAWKEALTGIGFVRYKYEKLTHLHCMAFRKVNDIKDLISDNNQIIDNSEMMFIPQDCHDEEDEITKPEDRSEMQDLEMAELMTILPNC